MKPTVTRHGKSPTWTGWGRVWPGLPRFVPRFLPGSTVQMRGTGLPQADSVQLQTGPVQGFSMSADIRFMFEDVPFRLSFQSHPSEDS